MRLKRGEVVWRLERGPWAGREVAAYPGRELVARVVGASSMDMVYVPVRMEGRVIVAQYEGYREC